MKRPKHIFRARRRGSTLYVGREPLPSVETWLQQNRARITRPGEVTMIEIWHDAECRYPQGGPCTCRTGPECRVKGEDPEAN
jgi:hypothetical protein